MARITFGDGTCNAVNEEQTYIHLYLTHGKQSVPSTKVGFTCATPREVSIDSCLALLRRLPLPLALALDVIVVRLVGVAAVPEVVIAMSCREGCRGMHNVSEFCGERRTKFGVRIQNFRGSIYALKCSVVVCTLQKRKRANKCKMWDAGACRYWTRDWWLTANMRGSPVEP